LATTKLIAAEALPPILHAKEQVVLAPISALLDRHVVGLVVDGIQDPAVIVVGPARLVPKGTDGGDIGRPWLASRGNPGEKD
jgi:hypothetical protein